MLCAAIPQGLKPAIFLLRGGTAEAVPFQDRVMKQLLRFGGFELRVDLGHDLKGVGDIDYVGFSAGPAAVGVEGDCASGGDEAPADYVGFLSVAAGGETFGMTRCGAGLADLVHVS